MLKLRYKSTIKAETKAMENKIYDIIIIGGGIAGLTAAVYAGRAGKTALVFENNSFGGQISYSPEVENFPGFSKISGLDLSDKLLSQARAAGAETAFDTVTAVADNGKYKCVSATSGEYRCKALIIAAGLTHKKAGIKGEEKFTGRGVSYCAVCDGAFFKGKNVAVFGGGNTAAEEALFLCDICKSVTLIHRRGELRADAALKSRLEAENNIDFKLNSAVTALKGEERLSAVTVTDVDTKAESDISVNALFIAIGREPNNKIFENVAKLDENGFINAGEDCRTGTDGVFAAGDCRAKALRQLTTAAADGAVAATEACRYIDGIG